VGRRNLGDRSLGLPFWPSGNSWKRSGRGGSSARGEIPATRVVVVPRRSSSASATAAFSSGVIVVVSDFIFVCSVFAVTE
jgi:hypothetical protein